MSSTVSERLNDFQVEALTQSFCDEVVGKHVHDFVKYRKIFENPYLTAEKFYRLFQDSIFRHDAIYTFFRGSKEVDSIVSTLPKEILTIICSLASPSARSFEFYGYEFHGTGSAMLSDLSYYLFRLNDEPVPEAAESCKERIQKSLASIETKQRRVRPEIIKYSTFIVSFMIISSIGLLSIKNNDLKV